MAEIHLVCNAHIDPIWQWEWEEGAATTISTFRAAADLCEEFDDFIFCHNEAMIYRWIEEFEPKLFARIQDLVRRGRWFICGGWYLQPDCNMLNGESVIRQMKLGHDYFLEKFGVTCQTAINFDSFGHNRGLVQLLVKAGYDSYLCTRPSQDIIHLPADNFVWVGYDGSEVVANRMDTGYGSSLGRVMEKVYDWRKRHPNAELALFPWGVGNHGGGPSRKDIADLNAFKAEHPEEGFRHSRPENYFKSLYKKKDSLPRYEQSLLQFAVGCYTSQIRLKQRHRELEGQLALTERMLSHACMAGLLDKYPFENMEEASRNIAMSEFHDALPGSSIQKVEETTLQTLAHGMEIANRLRARAYFALMAGQEPAAPGAFPVLVYNPMPYPVTEVVECEMMLADQNWNGNFTEMLVYQNGERLPSQMEKERSSIPLDWRKRVVFRATLPPMTMSRFDCRPNELPKKPVPTCAEVSGKFVFDNGSLHAEISRETGCLTSYKVDGFEYLKGDAGKLIVIDDSVDPWGMTVSSFRSEIGAFQLMDEVESARFASVYEKTLPAVRVVEDGEVRTVIESSLEYGHSSALVTFKLPKIGNAVEIDVRLFYGEKHRMVKLAVPSALTASYRGQGIFGDEELFTDGRECVSQSWVASEEDGRMLTLLNNGVYGSDFVDGEIRASLIRGASYTAHPLGSPIIVPQDRFSPCIDQGERLYTFVLEGGKAEKRRENVSREAQELNEPAYALNFFPAKNDGRVTTAARLEGDGVQMTAMHPTKDGEGVIVRLFESTGSAKSARLMLPLLGADEIISLRPYEVATFRVAKDGSVSRAELLD